jgi:hypothetical protein
MFFKKLTTELNEEQLKEVIIDFFEREGYKVNKKDIQFRIETTTIGYGMGERDVPCFNGCKIAFETKGDKNKYE